MHMPFCWFWHEGAYFRTECVGRFARSAEKQIIKIFNGCEVQIENSVTRVTVRHHEARRVMPNSYPQVTEFSNHT